MKKLQRPIAWFVVFAFISLLQLSAMPLRADQAPEPAGAAAANAEQGPVFVEQAGAPDSAAKKKSIVPIILIGVGVAALAAVLFLVVLKTKYDVRGSWTVTRSADFYWITNPRTFVFAGASRSSGTMNVSGFADAGPWTASGKKVDFTFTTSGSTTAYLWTFTGTFSDKDTITGTLNYHDAAHDINGTWTAVRAAAATAAPQPAFASEIKPADR